MFHKIRLTAWERIRDSLLDHPVGGGRGTGAVGEDDHRLKFCRPQRRRWRRHRRALIRAAALGGHKERRFTGRRHPRLGFREWKWSGGRLSAGNCPPLPARQVGWGLWLVELSPKAQWPISRLVRFVGRVNSFVGYENHHATFIGTCVSPGMFRSIIFR